MMRYINTAHGEWGTGHISSDDAGALIAQAAAVFQSRAAAMRELADECGGRCTVSFTGYVHSGKMPAVYLDRRFISFCAEIHAAILYDIRIAAGYTDD